jgi:hypothetical protein
MDHGRGAPVTGNSFTSRRANRNHSISGGTTRHHLYTLLTRFVEENLPANMAARAAMP